MLACNISHGPGGLEIKASGDGIDIGHLACEKKTGDMLALKGAGTDGRKGDSATRDKLVAPPALAFDDINVVGELFHKAVDALAP